jgi:glycine/D-amino acid oxidase-like deaminating enzyme
MGAATAYHLARRKYGRVVVVERDGICSGSTAMASGGVRHQYDQQRHSAFFDFCYQLNDYAQDIESQLRIDNPNGQQVLATTVFRATRGADVAGAPSRGQADSHPTAPLVTRHDIEVCDFGNAQKTRFR